MAQAIKNGSNGNVAKVDANNRLHTLAVNRTEVEQAVFDGNAYNINSGLITLTSAAESGILYYNHNESTGFKIDQIVVILGPSTGGSTSDTTHERVYKNPTTGTLISGETAVDVNSNRDFSSGNTLSNSLAYKGATGNTITDGSSHIESLVYPNSTRVFSVQELLKNGDSIAVSLEPNDSNTSMKCMVAIVGHLAISTND